MTSLLTVLTLAIVIAILGLSEIASEEKMRKGASATANDSEQTSVGTCPPLWTRFQNNCYRFYGGPADWESAERQCRETYHCSGEFSAHLGSIHDFEENNLIYNLWQSSLVAGLNESAFEPLANRANGVWLGMEDRESEGNYTWSDGSSVNLYYWVPGQPTNRMIDDTGNGEDCIMMWKTEMFNTVDKWNDAPCYYLFPFICKMPTE
ncbi:echinoidin-like [Amphiura filiformis]|uniref:echinoidin-like n=1 Tax=Amphiura filiformis TaxID=82378 RepID=UPI003B212472